MINWWVGVSLEEFLGEKRKKGRLDKKIELYYKYLGKWKRFFIYSAEKVTENDADFL